MRLATPKEIIETAVIRHFITRAIEKLLRPPVCVECPACGAILVGPRHLHLCPGMQKQYRTIGK